MTFQDFISLGNQMLDQIQFHKACYSSTVVNNFKKQYLNNLDRISKTDIVPEPMYCIEPITEAYVLQNNFEIFVDGSIYLPREYITNNNIHKVDNIVEAFSVIYSKKSEGKVAVIPGSKETFDFIMGINRLAFDTPAIPMFKASVFSTKQPSSLNDKQTARRCQTNSPKATSAQANNTPLLGWDSLD